MSNETDLDWLARNVHVWPKIGFFQGLDRPEGWRWVEVIELDSRAVVLAKYEDGKYTAVISEQQWLARRAELQNKPSFSDHPDAKCFAQSKGGCWFKNIVTDDVMPKDDKWVITLGSIVSGWCWVQDGYVLGDWRETLEKRPAELNVCKAEVVGSDKVIECNVTYEVSGNRAILHGIDMSQQAVTELLQEVPAEAPEFKPLIEEANRLAQEFKPFISIEHNQEQGMTKQQETKHDNEWFGRGKLPPVGVWCEVSGDGASPEKCKIIAYHKGQVALQWEFFNGGCLDILELTGEYWKFRPIRTDRELAIDQMCRDVGFDGLLSSMAAAKLYDAGYRKEPK